MNQTTSDVIKHGQPSVDLSVDCLTHITLHYMLMKSSGVTIVTVDGTTTSHHTYLYQTYCGAVLGERLFTLS